MTRTVGAAFGIMFIVLFFAVVASERARAATASPRAFQVTTP
jgi:di/tricarboxylate transporter